jgi:hypothetical protein
MKYLFIRCLTFLFLTLFVLSSSEVNAQKKADSTIANRCVEMLREAEKTYEAGRIQNIEGMLLQCIDNGFSKFEKIQAYRLIILSKLFNDEDEKAESYFLKLLKVDPEYTVNPVTDPSEFVNLYNSYRTNPVFAIGLKAGMNYSNPNASVPFGVYDTGGNTGKYKGYLNFQFGVNLDYYINKKFSIGADILFSLKKYEYSNVLLGYSQLTFTENQTWLDLPIVLKYTMGKKNLRYYVQGGGAAGLILGSNSTVIRKDVTTQSNEAVGPNINTLNIRNAFNYALVVGGGLRYKAGYGYIVLDVKYLYGLSNLSNVHHKYSNTDLVYKYGYIDNNFTLNSLMFSVGYYKSFYKPKKIITHEN